MSLTVWWLLVGACSVGTDLQEPGPAPPVHNPWDTDEPDVPGCYANLEMDEGDDGSVEGTGLDIYASVRTDLIVRSTVDVPPSLHLEVDYAYDTDGYLVRFSFDYGIDGDDDYDAEYTRDADHNVVAYIVDDDGDGFADYGSTAVWVGGRIVASTEDQDGDQVTDIWYTHSYDGVGRLARIDGDRGNDGSTDYVATRTCTDPVLYVGSTSVDEDNDGLPDFTDTFVDDDQNRQLFLEEDEGADLFVDFRGTYTYDGATASYATLDEERFTPPPNDDFVDVTHQEYTYDDQGRLVDLFTDGQYTDAAVSYSRLARSTWTFGGTCP